MPVDCGEQWDCSAPEEQLSLDRAKFCHCMAAANGGELNGRVEITGAGLIAYGAGEPT